MKTLILVLLFGYCLTDQKTKTDIECKCRLRLNTGKTLDKLKVSSDSLTVSDKCDRKDFDSCADACNKKISNETNEYDLDKPKADDSQNTSLGQLYCDKLDSDVNDAKILLSVTLECEIETEVTQDRNGTVVSVGSSVSQSAITRYVDSGFKQTLRCVDKKYAKSSTV